MRAEVPSSWVTQLRKGILELCLMSGLKSRPRYGYELVRLLGEIEGLVVQEGTVYPILSRMRQEGLLQTELRESAEGPTRKYYRLTPLGRRRLRAMNQYWNDLMPQIDALVNAS